MEREPNRFKYIRRAARGWAILLVLLTHAAQGQMSIEALYQAVPQSPVLDLSFWLRTAICTRLRRFRRTSILRGKRPVIGAQFQGARRTELRCVFAPAFLPHRADCSMPEFVLYLRPYRVRTKTLRAGRDREDRINPDNQFPAYLGRQCDEQRCVPGDWSIGVEEQCSI